MPTAKSKRPEAAHMLDFPYYLIIYFPVYIDNCRYYTLLKMITMEIYRGCQIFETDSAQEEIRELYRNLCLAPINGIECSNCVLKLNSRYLMSIMNFRFLIGLIESMLKPVVNIALSPYIPYCSIKCNGYTNTYSKIVDPEYKLQEDISFCKSIIIDWMRLNTYGRTIEFQIVELLEIFSEITDPSGLVLTLDTLCRNYDIWRPIRAVRQPRLRSHTQDGRY